MASPSRTVIITCAITGAVHTPSMTPHLPITPRQIADEAVAAAAAGAAVIHLHARHPVDGRPSPDPSLFGEFLPMIKSRCDAILGITTGGGQNMTVRERLAAPLAFDPEMCSLNMGSMNFGLFPALSRHRTFVHDWEQPYLEGSRDFIFRNTFADIEYILQALGERTRFEFECYDLAISQRRICSPPTRPPPLFVQLILGILGGMAPTPTTCARAAWRDRSSGMPSSVVLAPVATRWRWPPWAPSVARTCASGLRTVSTSARVGLRPATPNRSPNSHPGGIPFAIATRPGRALALKGAAHAV